MEDRWIDIGSYFGFINFRNPQVADNFLSATEGLLDLGMTASQPKSATSNLMGR